MPTDFFHFVEIMYSNEHESNILLYCENYIKYYYKSLVFLAEREKYNSQLFHLYFVTIIFECVSNCSFFHSMRFSFEIR